MDIFPNINIPVVAVRTEPLTHYTKV